jgi:hypothetical protein
MGENVRRLALIDAEKFNNLIDLLQGNTARQKIVDDAVRSSEEAGLIESHKTMQKSVNYKSSLVGNDIIIFLRKRDNYKTSVEKQNNDDQQQPAGQQPAGQQPAADVEPKRGTVRDAEKRINDHFKSRGITPSENGIKTNTSTITVSYSDMMMDLTRNYKKTEPNLNTVDKVKVFQLMKKTRMPVNYINRVSTLSWNTTTHTDTKINKIRAQH